MKSNVVRTNLIMIALACVLSNNAISASTVEPEQEQINTEDSLDNLFNQWLMLSRAIGTKMYEELCSDLKNVQSAGQCVDNDNCSWHIDNDDSSVTVSIIMPAIINRDAIDIRNHGDYIQGTVNANEYYCNFIISDVDFSIEIEQNNIQDNEGNNKVRSYSSRLLNQMVSLPTRIEIPSDIKAEYKDNILIMRVPKKQAAVKIPVI